MNTFLSLLLQAVLIGLNAFFACAEIAVISVSDAKLAQLMEQGNKKALRLGRLKSDSASFLATIQVAITLSGFLGSAFAADNFSGVITDAVVRAFSGADRELISSASVVLVTLILSYFTLVLGELVPKRLAMKKAEKLALSMSGIINAIAKVFKPIVWFLSLSTNLVLRLLGVNPKEIDETEYESDIKDLVDQGNRTGEIDSEEREIIHNLFEFDDITVGELATHRTELSVLYLEDDAEAWHESIVKNRFSHYPVCKDTADEVVGVLSSKDYFGLNEKSRENVLKNAVHPAYFVPEGVRADVLFKQMKKSRNHFAVVVDEYGGVSGVATMKDLLAQIVGDFDDDADDGPEIVTVAEDRYEIKGVASLDDVAELLGVELPIDEYDTFGGYIMGLCGTVGDDGETEIPETEALRFEKCYVESHRVVSVQVIKKEQQTENEEDD